MLTAEDVEARLLVLRRVSIGDVADYHAGLADGSVPDQHAADDIGVQLVLLGQSTIGGDAGLVVEVIHLRWHVEANRGVEERGLFSSSEGSQSRTSVSALTDGQHVWDGTYLQGFRVVLRLVVIYINTPTEKAQQFLLNAPAACKENGRW